MTDQPLTSANPIVQMPITMQTRYGRIEMPGNEGDLIGRFLREYGEWALYEARFVAQAMEPGARVADIGAYVGTFGLGLMAFGQPQSVCFVEANPRLVPLLNSNVARNAAIPTTVVGAVVIPASMRGPLVASIDTENAGSFSVAFGASPDRVSIDVTTRQMTLNELCAEYGPFSVIKLDVEGLENALLRDAFEMITSGKTKLWIECNEHERSLALCQTLLESGMDIHYFAYPVFSPENYNGSIEIIFPWAYEAGLWATTGAPPPLGNELVQAGCFMRRIRSIGELKRALWDTPRWAPADWAQCTGPAVVARAVHAILGEGFEDYLAAGRTHPGPAHWAEPLLPRLQRELERRERELDETREHLALAQANEVMLHAELDETRAYLVQARTLARANEVMLHAEREWIDAYARRVLEVESSNLYRLMLAARGLAKRYPRLYRVGRPVLVAIWRGLRYLLGRPPH